MKIDILLFSNEESISIKSDVLMNQMFQTKII